MTRAWLEIDRISVDHTSNPRVWDRVALDPKNHAMLSTFDAHVELTGHRVAAIDAILDVVYARNRWMLQPRVHDVYRNGVQLQRDERYPLDNGDRIEAMSGTWLRFLDDTVPLPLPRLRQVGRASLFAPTPEDGADRWRAMLQGRDELLAAELVAELPPAGEDAVLAGFPCVVDVVHTPRGLYAITKAAAGVPLAALMARTREQGAALDDDVIDHVRARCIECIEQARAAGWHRLSVYEENVIVTWEGRVAWLGFVQPRREMSPVSLEPSANGSNGSNGSSGIEEARSLAGVVAQLFPEEHAAEMALREEVTLWTRDGLADLERATRGRRSP